MKQSLKYTFFAAMILLPSLSIAAEAAPVSSSVEIDKAAARITGSKKYLAVTGVNVPIASRDGFNGMIAIDAGLEIEDDKKRKYARAVLPRLRDSLRSAVHLYMNTLYVNETVPDLTLICKRLQKAADRSLGPGVAKVTVSSAIIHPYS